MQRPAQSPLTIAIRRALAPALALSLGPAALLAPGTANAELPTVCAPCTGGVNWSAAGSPSTYTVSGNRGVIQQRLDRETFNWATFNIGRGKTVEFRQPASTSVALNRIHQASPSEIFGALKANGQVYLVNQNGILFKPGAEVDVNSLLATSLDLNDAVANLFEQVGLVNAINQVGNPAALVADGDPGAVEVAAGATLKAQQNGRIILAGGRVRNAGTVEVSGIGGQAILVAAEDRIYLLTSTEEGVRGLAVEVEEGGTVENLGRILAEQGNITLAGMTVNQDGVVRATTAVAANGSIRLQAQDTVSFLLSGDVARPVANRAGTVSFGRDSETAVLPDRAAKATAVDELSQLASRITVRGKDVTVRRGARISAPGGHIDIVASGRPDPEVPSVEGTITVERGAILDAAGSTGTVVSAARNVVSIELRGNELADAPVQRDGPLFGKTIQFDLRDAPSIARVDAAIANIERGVGERTAAGGSISLAAGDAVTLERGALLDVSGGEVLYTPAYLATTRLIREGVIVDIADADPDLRYDAILGDVSFTHAKWGPEATETFAPFRTLDRGRYEPGYVEGRDAGSITIEGLDDGQVLDATIEATMRARTTRGRYQRLAPAALAAGDVRPYEQWARGGRLTVDINSGDVHYSAAQGWSFVADGIDEFDLAVDRFTVDVGASLQLVPGGALTVAARSALQVDGDIGGAGATVNLSVNDDATLEQGSLVLGPAARIDVSGDFVNDSALLHPRGNTAAVTTAGGHVSLHANGDLTLAAGSTVVVDGGLRLLEDGSREVGSGGSIRLTAELPEGFVETPSLVLDGTLSGHVFAGGNAHSRLAITARDLSVQNGVSSNDGGRFTVGTDLLLEHGFTDISLSSAGGALTVQPGTRLTLVPRYLDLRSDGRAAGPSAATGSLQASTGDLAAVAAPRAIAEADLRSPTSLTLTAAPFAERVIATPTASPEPTLVIGRGARLETDLEGSITLTSTGAIELRGSLRAPAGDITVSLTSLLDASETPDPAAGYDARRALTLYDGAVLDASGTLLIDRDLSSAPLFASRGLIARTPLAGGTIRLRAEEGFVVAAPGARLDVSGVEGSTATATPDASGRVVLAPARAVADAGAIDVVAANGIQFFADIAGHAPAGAAGGSFALSLDGDLRKSNAILAGGVTPFPETALRIVLDAAAVARATPGAALAGELFGRADFDLDLLARGGFDDLALSSRPNLLQRGPGTSAAPLMEARIDLVGALDLTLDGSLVLDAPILFSDGGRANLEASYLRIGFSDESLVTSDTAMPVSTSVEPTVKYFSATAGSGRASFQGDLVDLVGFTALRGFGGGSGPAVRFASSGDLRLSGVRSPDTAVTAGIDGALVTAADTELVAARTYVTTLSNFEILNQAAGAEIRFARSGRGNPDTPLGAAGTLRVNADRITQGGILMVPHGQITLDAETRLQLTPGSLTSVSGGDTTILFGRTEVGDWIFPFGDAAYVFTSDPDATLNEYALPEKRITLVADGTDGSNPTGVVDLTGAVIDVLGGGRLRATEFLPGPLGSVDLADAAGASDADGLARFALLPTERGLAPLDPLETSAFGQPTTRQVRLREAVGDLAAGVYAILPPRYALLPGAYLLSRDDDSGALTAVDGATGSGRVTSADGLPLVQASFEWFGADDAAPVATQRYRVESGLALRQRAEYRESDADAFFAADAARAELPAKLLPRDGGTVVLTPNLELVFGGARLAAGRGAGRGTQVDIAATDIFISASGTGGAGVNLRAADLAAFDADSLFIGGTRRSDASGTTIEALLADTVTVAGDVRLDLPEVLLGALDTVDIAAGARLHGAGRRVAATPTLTLDGAGALAWLSTAELPDFVRTNAPGASTALVHLGAGAHLSGAGSLLLDSSGDTVLDGTIAVGGGGGLHLGAAQIALGAPPTGAAGLRLVAQDLEDLDVATLVLSSLADLDLYGDFALTLDQLRIDAPGIRGQADGAVEPRAVIRANGIVLGNSAGRSSAGAATGNGSLAFASRDAQAGLVFSFGATAGLVAGAPEDGDFDVTGFDAVTIDAPLVRAVADHALAVDGDLELRTDLLVALDGASLVISATGDVASVGSAASAVASPDPLALLGGSITLSGASLSHGTRLWTPSGTAVLTARTGDLALLDGGEVDAAGLSHLDFTFADVATRGGRVELRAAQGDLILAGGSRVSVAGGLGDDNADAGSLVLAAAGGELEVANAAVLDGAAGAGATTAAVAVDVGSFASSFRGLNQRLDAGDFLRERRFRVRGAGGLTVDAATTVRAARIELVTEGGALTVAGTLNADGLRGGRIELAAATTLTIADGARLSARSSGGFFSDPTQPTVYDDGYRGGQVELAAPTGSVTLAGGVIDVSGTRLAGGSLVADDSGVVRVTAARTGGNAGMAINGTVDTTFSGAHDIQFVGHRSYDSAATTTVVSDALAFSNNATTIRNTLFEPDAAAPAHLRIVPGVEIRTSGNLTLASLPGVVAGVTAANTGLLASTIGAGVLTYRSAGNLTVSANALLRDGITTESVGPNNVRYIADTLHSWSLQLVAGADLGSSDLLATGATAVNLSLGNGAQVVTGSGDINLAASGDITLDTNARVLVVGRHFTEAELGGLYNYDGTINIPTGAALTLQFLRGASFPDFGGHVGIEAGGNLSGAASTQFVSDWHVRMGGRDRTSTTTPGTVPRAWGLSFGPTTTVGQPALTTGTFNQGIGAWGGGNIDVRTGGDVNRVQLNIPTVGRQVGVNSWTGSGQVWTTTSDIVDVIGGGVVTVEAGGDVAGIDVFVARGEARVRAEGDITTFGSGGTARFNRFALGNTTVDLSAGDRIDIGSVVNDTTLALRATHPVANPLFETFHYSYSARAGIHAQALGEVLVVNRTGLPVAQSAAENLYPSRLALTSVKDDVVIQGTMNLFSNSSDGFTLLAGDEIRSGATVGSLTQVDVATSVLPSFDNPARPDQNITPLSGHGLVPVYLGDSDANVLVARTGDLGNMQIATAKRLLAYAGRDVLDPSIEVQHVNAGDLSVFQAGDDVRMRSARAPSGRLSSNPFSIVIGGPGEVQVLAGSDIDFGTAQGIRTVGDLANPALTSQGADLTLLAGIAEEELAGLLDDAIGTYLVDVLLPFAPGGGPGRSMVVTTEALASVAGLDADERAEALTGLARRRAQATALLDELAAAGRVPAGDADPASRLRALGLNDRLRVLLDILYGELELSGVEAADVTSVRLDDFRRGYAAIDALFPAGTTYAGNILSTLSTVQTRDGGSIRLAAPGGFIDVGATANDAIDKPDIELGHVVFRAGEIKAYVAGDFNVNSTRVFAQNGGDILIWSSTGDIDAGRGAKTAATIPATVATFDEFGNFVDEPPLAVSGSGIRNFAPSGVAAGTLFLFAPQGVINAGDAGIGSAGNLVVAANQILGADNFDVGGTVTGVLAADAGGISVGLAAVGDVAASATRATEKATQEAAAKEAAQAASNVFDQPQLSIISVEVLGFGG